MITLNNIKIFIKTKQLAISYVLLLCICNIFLIRQLNFVTLPFFIEYLAKSQTLGIMGFLFFSFLSFEYLSYSRRIELEEILSAIKDSRVKIWTSKTLVMFSLILLYSLVILAYNLFAYYSYNIDFPPYLSHIIKNIVLNIVLVGLIGTGLGAVLSQYVKRITAYIIIILIALIISPFFDEIALAMSFSFTNIYTYFDIFKILAPNLNWMTDNLYGLPIELCRWNLAFFWISIFASIATFKYSRKNIVIRCIGILLGIISLVNLASYMAGIDDSIVRRDDRTNGFLYGDQYYWREHENKIAKANFEVLKYEMIFDISRNLSGTVHITIDPSQEGEVHPFTLYRGYRITSITDEEGNLLSYSRDGNYFEINNDFKDEIRTITVKYVGNGNRFYSNSQGVALLGYFPYYPMAGHLKLWDEETNSFYVNTNFAEKEFNVTINSPSEIISNLENISDNIYSGTSTTVSLVGGFVKEENKSGFNYTYSPLGESEDGYDFLALEAEWQKRKAQIGEKKDISFYNKKIIFLPLTLIGASDADNETLVMFDDHILSASTSMQVIPVNLIESLIPYSSNKKELKMILPSYIFYDLRSLKYDTIASYDSLSILKHKLVELEETGEIDKYFEMREEFAKLFLNKVDILGEDYVLKSVYEYLLDENDTTHEVDFLYNLK